MNMKRMILTLYLIEEKIPIYDLKKMILEGI